VDMEVEMSSAMKIRIGGHCHQHPRPFSSQLKRLNNNHLNSRTGTILSTVIH
jgi:hypothetical protein